MAHLRLVVSERGHDHQPETDPFSAYRAAGLRNCQFGIDGAPPYFWGYAAADDGWNGWATPRFCREVAELVADWVTDADDTATWWWDGATLHVRHPGVDDTETVEPDALGLYQFDGWCWVNITRS